ncbi:MAG: DUF4143 domain-containing protein [Bacilli bacterium]|nr:DUF4143 domain-containing protein [Bacilli bacterium]
MLKRKAWDLLETWFDTKLALIVFGSRQVGKTCLISNFLKEKYGNNVYTLNFHENTEAIETLLLSKNVSNFFLRLTALENEIVLEDDTCIFIDEVQEYYNYISKHHVEKYFDIISETKYISEKTNHRIVLSGSLLRLEMDELITNPEGYLYPVEMYPMDFEEFLWADRVDPRLISVAKECFEKREEIPGFIHDLFLKEYQKYVLVGGMPNAVNEFVTKNSFQALEVAHKAIEYYISKDITKYAEDDEKLKIKEIYRLIPTELSSPSRKFFISHIPDSARNNREVLSFAWLNKAGVAISCYIVDEPVVPLLASSKRNQFKLFHEDVGLLGHMLLDSEAKIKILNGDLVINLGALYENSVAQQLYANETDSLYYYNSKKYGEVDFLIEKYGEVIPIEVKSGKNYTHRALNNIMDIPNYHLRKAICLYNGNLKQDGNVLYAPIYCVMFVSLF